MVDRPFVSVVVPVHNGGRYLAEALSSLFAQSRRPDQIVVVDDGSTDETPSILDEHGDRLTRLRQPRAGPAAARNAGVQAATGVFVAFLDADDVCHPERLARQVAAFSTRPSLDVCLTRIQNFWVPELREEAELLSDHVLSRPRPGTVTQSGMVRRQLLEEIRFDPGMLTGEDQDWLVRAAEREKEIQILPEILIRRRMHAGNVTRLEKGRMDDDMMVWVKRSLDRRRKDGGRPVPIRIPRTGDGA
jgi:glycosyltransferase involved in cell wall biosynthesis